MVLLQPSSKSIALVVGINYTGTDVELKGCINDAEHVQAFLTSHAGFQPSNVTVLTDTTRTKPTRVNIVRALRTILRRVRTEGFTQVWFSYAGHGIQVRDRNGDERRTVGDKQGRDEALMPLDYKRRGVITDDALYRGFVRRLPKHVRMVSLIDACHTGTSLDLPYVYQSDTGAVETNRSVRDVRSLAKVVKISGCQDKQTSADAYIGGKYQGAMTCAFLKMLELHRYSIGTKQLVEQMVRYLSQNGYGQIPTLSTTAVELLSDPLMGQVGTPNIRLKLKGDAWCHTETRWNIRSAATGEPMYSKGVELGMQRETLEVDLQLEAGQHTLELFDDYGDGGVVGEVVDLPTARTLSEFRFVTGPHMAVQFVVKG